MDEIVVESELKYNKIHNAQQYRNIPWTMLTLQYAISTLRNQSYVSVILAVSLENIWTLMLVGSTLIYTDGWKTNDAAGCAAIIGQSKYSDKL